MPGPAHAPERSSPTGPGRVRPRAGAPRLSLPWAVWLIAAVGYAVEVAVAGRYGYDRDELYFMVAGQHLSAGYVDQPPLTPLLARLCALVTGDTLVGLRALAALGLPVVVLLTASMARALGASRSGQCLAALAVACCGEYLGTFHRMTTTPVDLVFWAVLLWLVVRLLVTADPIWWVSVGAMAGVALEAKWNIAFLLFGLASGFAVTARSSPAVRALLRSPYLLIGGAAAVVLIAPDIAWQAAHGLPNLGVYQHLQQSAGRNRLAYWPAQVLYTSIAPAALWARGLRRVLRDSPIRPAGIAVAVVLVTQFVLGGKPYYPEGVYPLLFAAGSAGLPLTGTRAARYCAAGSLATLVSIPVLPAVTLAYAPLQDINPELGEQVGWAGEVRLVARVHASAPGAAVLAGNYGEAGAIDRYGPSLGLPSSYCGHNSFWWWGPPPARDTSVVAIGVSPALLRTEFRSVRLAAVWDNGLGVINQEQGVAVYVASGLRDSWITAWPAFRHYD